MGKRYKGVACVYCLDRPAADGDHVISRQFFPKDKRANLPKVPACKECNNEKSKLEHYLTAVMPFGAQHGDAGVAIEMTAPRLAKNRKLHAELEEGMARAPGSVGSPPDMTLPLQGDALEKLCEFIVKGLAHHHWKLRLGPDHFIRASFFNEAGRRFFDPLFAGAARDRVQADLGDGVFVYEGVQSKDCAELTLWRMTIYGAAVGGDQRSPGERCSIVYGLTIPKAWPVTSKLMEILNA
jgi:hypothetical protein